jgi:hypothetical protein
MVHNQTSITTLYPSFGEVRAVVFFELNGDEYLSQYFARYLLTYLSSRVERTHFHQSRGRGSQDSVSYHFEICTS